MQRASALQNTAIGLGIVAGVLVVLFVAGVTFMAFGWKKSE